MKLYAGGYLTYYMPKHKHSLAVLLDSPAPLKEILDSLHIPVEEVHLVALNGELTDLETIVVSDADEVRIYSSINGG